MVQGNMGTALVTGASTGIGAVYADRLARRGFDLVLVARNQTRLEALAQRLRTEAGRTVEVLVADLTVRADLTRVEARLATDPALTLLVNNAGRGMDGGLLGNEQADLESLVALNITATTLLARAAARGFAERRSGTIVNISSVLALAPELFSGVYSGSKAYLLNLSLSLALELKDAGVRVQAVLPGATRTEIWGAKDVDALLPGMVMEVGDLVDAALLGLDRGETVTIPPLAEEERWTSFNEARLALTPHLSRKDAAARYKLSAVA